MGQKGIQPNRQYRNTGGRDGVQAVPYLKPDTTPREVPRRQVNDSGFPVNYNPFVMIAELFSGLVNLISGSGKGGR